MVAQNPLLDAALAYAARGWAVFPCKPREKIPATQHGFKDASRDADQIRRWWAENPAYNVGIACGVSGLAVVDVDPRNGGDVTLAALEHKHGPLPLTPICLTGGGGQHYYFRYMGRGLPAHLGAGVDLKGHGGYVVAPPSIHPSGRPYLWDAGAHFRDIPLAPLPSWIAKHATVAMPIASQTPVPDSSGPILEGVRHTHLTSVAGALRRQGCEYGVILDAIRSENDARCQPPLPEEEVVAIAKSVSRYPPASPPINEHVPIGAAPKSDPPKELAAEAYHGITGEIIRAISPHTEASDAALLVSFLVAAGNCIGRGPHAIAEADQHRTNLFAALVGDTSKGRKGSSWGYIRELFSRVDSTWTGTRVKSGLASGEGLVYAVRDAQEKDEKEPKPGQKAPIVDLGVQDKRLLALEPELASVLKVMSRDSNILSAEMRMAWDTGNLQTLTKNNPTVATNAHISVLGHITKDELLRYLSDTEAANGWANRFLWVYTYRARVLPEGGGDVDYQRILPMLHDALVRARTVGRIARDAQARSAWAKIYEDLSDGRPGLLGSVTARAEAQVLRLSVLYAALDGADAIRLPHLKAALAVWEYCDASCKYIFGDATGDPIADQILTSLGHGELTRTAINGLFQRNVSSTRIAQALDLLARHKLARMEMRSAERGAGRPSEVWVRA